MTTPITLVSVTAYGKLHGVAKSAAQKWEAKGYLTKREGKVWVEASDRALEHAGLGRFGDRSGGGRPPTATGHPDGHPGGREVAVVEAAAQAKPPPLDGEYLGRADGGGLDYEEPETLRRLDAFVETLLSGEYSDLITAETVKANALALKHVLAARKEAGRLVEMELAEQVLFEEARAARDAWIGFPAKIGPLLAAELGVDADRLIEGLTAHVQQQLDDLGEPDPDFSDDGRGSDDEA